MWVGGCESLGGSCFCFSFLLRVFGGANFVVFTNFLCLAKVTVVHETL